MRLSLPALLSVAALLSASPCSDAEDARACNIRLHRPRKIGARTHENFKMTVENSQRLSSDGRVVKETKEKIEADLSGLNETVEVSPHGKVQKLKFTVGKSSVRVNSVPVPDAFNAGAVISGMLDGKGKPTFSCTDGELAPTAIKILSILFELTPDRPNDTNDDIAFGTNQPRTVGSEWEINKAETLKSMPPDVPFKLTENQISGRVKFPSVKLIAGKEHYLVQAEVTLKPTAMTGLPPNFKLASLKLTAGMENVVPVDENAVIPSGKASLWKDITGDLDTPKGKLLMEIIERREKEEQSLPAD